MCRSGTHTGLIIEGTFLKHLLFIAVFTSMSALSSAQPVHLERLQAAGIECVADVLIGVDSFELDADERAPYLRPALVSHWMNEGHTVYTIDSSNVDLKLPRFRYRIDKVSIHMRRLGSGLVERTASVAMWYIFTGPDAQILADSLCSQELVDTVDSSLAGRLTDPRYEETNVEFEDKGWLHRVLEPTVIVVAAVIGTYLFFNLRSKRSDNG